MSSGALCYTLIAARRVYLHCSKVHCIPGNSRVSKPCSGQYSCSSHGRPSGPGLAVIVIIRRLGRGPADADPLDTQAGPVDTGLAWSDNMNIKIFSTLFSPLYFLQFFSLQISRRRVRELKWDMEHVATAVTWARAV